MDKKYPRLAKELLGQMEEGVGHQFRPEEEAELLEGLERVAMMNTGESSPVPEAVTLEWLRDTPDSHLTMELWDFVCAVMNKAGRENEAKTLAGLPEGLRAVHHVTVVESEVYNGGFAQYFSNQGPDDVEPAIAALGKINAVKKAELLRQASPAFVDEIVNCPNPDNEAYLGVPESVLEAYSDRFDSPYYALEDAEAVYGGLVEWIRRSPEDFVYP